MVQMWGVGCTGSENVKNVGSCIPEVEKIQMWGVVPEVRIVKCGELQRKLEWSKCGELVVPEVGTARSPSARPCWSSPGSGTEPVSSSSKQNHVKGTEA